MFDNRLNAYDSWNKMLRYLQISCVDAGC